MIKAHTDAVIEFLNSLMNYDKYAVAELLTFQAVCNEAMADHPSVQVRGGPTLTIRPGTFRVGLLGILNGFCGTIESGEKAGWGPIVAIYENGELIRFARTDTDAISPFALPSSVRGE